MNKAVIILILLAVIGGGSYYTVNRMHSSDVHPKTLGVACEFINKNTQKVRTFTLPYNTPDPGVWVRTVVCSNCGAKTPAYGGPDTPAGRLAAITCPVCGLPRTKCDDSAELRKLMGQYALIMGARMKSHPTLEWHQALEEVKYANTKCGLRRPEDWALVGGLGVDRQIKRAKLERLFITQASEAFAGKSPEDIIAILSHVIGVKLPGCGDERSSGERALRAGQESFEQFTQHLKPDATATDLPEAAVELARNEAIVWAGRECLESAMAEVEPPEAMKLGANIVRCQWPLDI